MSVIIDGSAGVTTNSGAVYNGIASQTAKPATGLSVDFLDIPSWAKRITVMFNGVSLSGTASFLFQLGSGSIQTTGYNGGGGSISNSSANNTAGSRSTSGIPIAGGNGTALFGGFIVFTLLGSNTWVANGSLSTSTSSSGCNTGAGSVSLSGVLDRLRITTDNSADTFDAGSINVMYE